MAETNGHLPNEPNGEEPARKPRDARLVHLILANIGITSYQDRVPVMLMDFAYRYTSSILQDALLNSDIINGTSNTGGQNPPASINADDLRMSIAARVNHQFQPVPPREFLLEMAAERNRVALPAVGQEYGIRLPPEKYCLTGVNWDMVEGWEESDEEEGRDEKREDEEGGMEVEVADLFGGSAGGQEDTNMSGT